MSLLLILVMGCSLQASQGTFVQQYKDYSVPIIVSTGACKHPGLYLAGQDQCSYRECSLDPTPTLKGNYGLVAVTRQCAPGTGVPQGYPGGFTNPCVKQDMTCGQKFEFVDIPVSMETVGGNKYYHPMIKLFSKKSGESIEEKLSTAPLSKESKISHQLILPKPSKRTLESVEVSDKIVHTLDPSPTPKVVKSHNAKQATLWSSRKSNFSHRPPFIYKPYKPRRKQNQQQHQHQQQHAPNHPPQPSQPPQPRHRPTPYKPKIRGFHDNHFNEFTPHFYVQHHGGPMFQKGKFYYQKANRLPF